MIHILVTRQHAYTVRQYLQIWGRDVRRLVSAMCYEELVFRRKLAPGTYIFADLERLTDPQMELARLAWREMARRPEDFQLLNEPGVAMRRFALLEAMHAAGINRFRAYRIGGGAMPERYPVFVRRENDHDGAQTPLLHTPDQLRQAVSEMTARGIDSSELLATEFCDTADAAGIYRKYSVFRIGPRIIARHLFHSGKWMVKISGQAVDEQNASEELRYIQTNPHEAELMRIFNLAHIDYGRIDYALLDGQIQVWEINTNPTISVPPNRTAPLRMQGQALFSRELEKAWAELDRPAGQAQPLNFHLPRRLRHQLGAGPRQRAARHAGRAMRWLARQPMFTHPQDLDS